MYIAIWRIDGDDFMVTELDSASVPIDTNDSDWYKKLIKALIDVEFPDYTDDEKLDLLSIAFDTEDARFVGYELITVIRVDKETTEYIY